MIERSLIGGTCVNVGCTPTKALVPIARVAHMARRGREFGVEIAGAVRVEMKRVMKRMKEIAGQSNQGVTRWLEGMEDVTLLRGHARFEGPQQVRVEGELLEAEKIFLNVGTRAFVPEFPGLKSSSYLTNSNVLDLESLPEHLIVVGGSYVGLEFGQIFRRLGSEVTIVERGARLISREDEDVSVEVQRFLESEGIELRLEADCFEVKETAE